MRLLIAILVILATCAFFTDARAQCRAVNSAPNFAIGGNVFGLSQSQWKSYFAAKADSAGGVLCNPKIHDLSTPIDPGDAVNKQYVDNATTPIVLHDPVDLATNGAAEFTGSISGTTLTVTNVISGAIGPDQLVGGAGVAAGTRIVSGLGATWTVSTSQSVGSEAMTASGALPANIYSNGTAGVGATLTGIGNGALSVDGVAATAGMRILDKDEASPAKNGVYAVTEAGDSSHPYVLVRSSDFNSSANVTPNSYFLVQSGTIDTATGWLMSTSGVATIGVTPIRFIQFTKATPGLGFVPLDPTNNLSDVASSSASLLHLGARSVDVLDYGATCGMADSTTAVQNAVNALAGHAIITVSCPIAIAGNLYLPSYTHLMGAGPMFYPGMLATGGGNPQTQTWPPTAGPAITCTSTTGPACIVVDGLGVEAHHLNLGNPRITDAPPTSGAWTPISYPPIVATAVNSNWSGLHLHHMTFTAASRCIDLEGTPNYGTAGIVGTEFTINDLFMNPCLDVGILEHQIDNTGRIYNISYSFWWHRDDSSAVRNYVRTHSIGLKLKYAANTEFNNVEFFLNKIAIDQENDTVHGGFDATFAANGIQMTNISGNLVCQFMGNESGTSLISTGRISNLILYQDTTETPYCALDSPAAIDLAATFGANWMVSNAQVGYVQTLAAIGQGSSLHFDGLDVLSYSFFSGGAPAFKVSAGSDLMLSNTLVEAVRPASGAGNLLGQGLDSTQGYMASQCVGGGTKPSEGKACLLGSLGTADTSGYVGFYLPNGARNGYVGFSTAAGANLAADSGSVFLRPNVSTSNPPFMWVGSNAGGLVVNVAGIPTSCTIPVAQAAGTLYLDGTGHLAPCP